MNPEDQHGQEMMSSELADVVPPNTKPGDKVTSTVCLVAKYSSGQEVSVICILNTLADGRVDLDGIPSQVGVALFWNYQHEQDMAEYHLTVYDFAFELGKKLTVYALYGDTCSVTFSND